MSARPFVKWAGGKTKLLPELLKHVPEKIDTYVEPFVGGGALFFELANQRRFRKAIICDMNAELINAFVVVWRSFPALVIQLERHKEKHSEEYFYEVRALDTSALSDVARAARFIYLNKTCFNGLYRVNKAGKFNVPFGKYKNPTVCDLENLREVSKLLREVEIEFVVADYGRLLENLDVFGKGGFHFVYCDPPYDTISKNADFTSYTEGGFGWKEQERLEAIARAIPAGRTKIVLSNADTPRVRKLYEKWTLHEVRAERSINSNPDKRGKVGELVIT